MRNDNLPKPSLYQELFKFDSYVPFLYSYDFVRGYQSIDGLAFTNNDRWFSFMSLKAVERSLGEGVEIFKSEEKYKQLKDGLYSVVEEIRRLVSSIEKRTDAREVCEFFRLVSQFRQLYFKTEFFYTDRAFERAAEFPIIKKNFESFSKFKIDGRSFLNELLFVKDSILGIVLKAITRITSVRNDMLLLYTSDELIELVNGRKVDRGTLEERKLAYFIYALNNTIFIISGDKAQNIQDIFTQIRQTQEIRGTVAYMGIVRARAKVFKVGISNYRDIHRMIDEMIPGQVLVVETTEPSIIVACEKASAIVTNQGGMMSHAAIVSREFGIPCIVGTGNATEMIKDGDLVEVDAERGVVKIIKKANN